MPFRNWKTVCQGNDFELGKGKAVKGTDGLYHSYAVPKITVGLLLSWPLRPIVCGKSLPFLNQAISCWTITATILEFPSFRSFTVRCLGQKISTYISLG